MKATELTEEHRQAAFWQTFHSPGGRIVLDILNEIACVKDTTFVPGDSHGTAFNEGRRSLLLDINRYMEDLNHDDPGQPDTDSFAFSEPVRDASARSDSERPGLTRRALSWLLAGK